MTVKNVPFSINGREIGINNPPYCIAEVGINHNGSMEECKKMMMLAKIQKRNPDVCVPEHQKSSISPSDVFKLVKGIRGIEKATQYKPGPRKQFEGENSKKSSLRK